MSFCLDLWLCVCHRCCPCGMRCFQIVVFGTPRPLSICHVAFRCSISCAWPWCCIAGSKLWPLRHSMHLAFSNCSRSIPQTQIRSCSSTLPNKSALHLKTNALLRFSCPRTPSRLCPCLTRALRLVVFTLSKGSSSDLSRGARTTQRPQR